MKAYSITFIKKDGSERIMQYCKLCDIRNSFIASRLLNKGSDRILPIGQELVWDLESDAWRIVNHNTKIGEILSYEIDEEIFADN